jgi:hypothetical protein
MYHWPNRGALKSEGGKGERAPETGKIGTIKGRVRKKKKGDSLGSCYN